MNELPKWFTGTVYDKGAEVKNPFTGEKATLTANELSMYDFIMGVQLMRESFGFQHVGDSLNAMSADGLDWFKEINPKAFMVLLD